MKGRENNWWTDSNTVEQAGIGRGLDLWCLRDWQARWTARSPGVDQNDSHVPNSSQGIKVPGSALDMRVRKVLNLRTREVFYFNAKYFMKCLRMIALFLESIKYVSLDTFILVPIQIYYWVKIPARWWHTASSHKYVNYGRLFSPLT